MKALAECWSHIRGIISTQLFVLAASVAPEDEKTSALIAVHDHLDRVHAMLIDDETDRAGA